jgi:hypothetical protein
MTQELPGFTFIPDISGDIVSVPRAAEGVESCHQGQPLRRLSQRRSNPLASGAIDLLCLASSGDVVRGPARGDAGSVNTSLAISE